jgi:hypothetical protein
MRHALVKDGQIVDFRDYAPNVDHDKLSPGKPKMLIVETVIDPFDPVTQVQEGPTYEFEEDRVVERYTSRAKNADEIEAMKAEKDAAIEAEFRRLYCAPILYAVGGQEYEFHADPDARENIQGVLQMYREAALVGLTLPDPRPWTPKGFADPIQISRAQLAGLGILIGARKDGLHTIKKARQKALSLLTDPADIHAVDPASGWDLD